MAAARRRRSAALVSALLPLSGALVVDAAFLSIHSSSPARRRPASVCLLASASFDFSSRSEWEAYYAADDEDAAEEWHSSVPLEIVADHCLAGGGGRGNILVAGCGTSRLPEAVWLRSSPSSSAPPTSSITLLDSSPTCIRRLRRRYGEGDADRKIRYVCGDALRLSSLLRPPPDEGGGGDGTSAAAQPPRFFFDAIVDKGLTDALLCGEGWNGPVRTLLREAASVLRPGGGRYVLVSYRLSASMKEFLSAVGRDVGLTWEYDCTTTDRVGISVATKVSDG